MIVETFVLWLMIGVLSSGWAAWFWTRRELRIERKKVEALKEIVLTPTKEELQAVIER